MNLFYPRNSIIISQILVLVTLKKENLKTGPSSNKVGNSKQFKIEESKVKDSLTYCNLKHTV